MAKSRFRIIALRPITPQGRDEATITRVKGIQKKVFGKNWMYFYSGYRLDDVKNGIAYFKEEWNEIAEIFYQNACSRASEPIHI